MRFTIAECIDATLGSLDILISVDSTTITCEEIELLKGVARLEREMWRRALEGVTVE